MIHKQEHISKQLDSLDCNAEFKHISLVNPDQTIDPTKTRRSSCFGQSSFF